MFPTEDAVAHAQACYPSEACGLWVEQGGTVSFKPCKPSRVKDHFAINPREWLEAEKAGTIKGIFHVHPEWPPVPSPGDLVALEAWGVPWAILSWPKGDWAVFEPQGRRVDLLGRTFRHGSTDCFGLVRDYYRRLGVELPNIPRADGWWNRGENLYVDHYESAGFAKVSDMKEHDLLALQIASDVPNHGAIYLGNDRILHHLESRLSVRAIYGDFYRKSTTLILRHRNLC